MQRRNIYFDCFKNYVGINLKISMRNMITHSNYSIPRDIRKVS